MKRTLRLALPDDQLRISLDAQAAIGRKAAAGSLSARLYARLPGCLKRWSE
jgi:hypothetical protein